MPVQIDKQILNLEVEMESFLKAVELRHRNNFFLGRFLVLMGILLAASSVIVGLLNHSKIALILAVIAGAMSAIDSAFAVRDVGEFQRIISSETRNLLSPIRIGSIIESDLPKIQEAFYALRKNFDQNLPKGSGMEAVKKLMDDLNKSKKP